MARTRTTIRRIDPWSILKFGFVANLVLLGIQLLAGAVVWYVIQRLELIQTVCELAATVGFEECGVDGGALFDTFLVLGLLGVVIQTGIMVFLTFLANLIFDLTGGIAITLDDERDSSRTTSRGSGVGSRGATGATGAAAMDRSSSRGSRGSRGSRDSGSGIGPAPIQRPDRSPSSDDTTTHGSGSSGGDGSGGSDGRSGSSGANRGSTSTGGSGDEDTLFGRS